MKKPAQPRNKRFTTSADMTAPAHNQIMDYLQLAKSSVDPAFVKAALELATERQKQQQRAEAKISPGTAATLGIIVTVASASASWFALVHYPGNLGFVLVSVVSALAILLFCLIVLLSGHLSRGDFMAVVRLVEQRLRQLNPFSKGSEAITSISASKDEPPRFGEGSE